VRVARCGQRLIRAEVPGTSHVSGESSRAGEAPRDLLARGPETTIAINDLVSMRSVIVNVPIVVMFRLTLTESDRVSRKTETFDEKNFQRSSRAPLLDAIQHVP